MKMKKTFLFLFTLVFCIHSFSEAQSYQVTSFDNNMVLTVNPDDSLTWSVDYKKKPVIKETRIALILDDRILPGDPPKIRQDTLVIHHEEIIAVIPNKDKMIKDDYKELTLRFDPNFSIQFRVYNEGVAYRFITDFGGMIEVKSEIMDLAFPGGTTAFFPMEKSMYSHFERAYLLKSIDTIPDKSFCSLPVLFTTKDSVRVLCTEADLYDYPCMFLQGTHSDKVKAIFPHFVLESFPDPKRPDRSEILTPAGYIAKTDGMRSFP